MGVGRGSPRVEGWIPLTGELGFIALSFQTQLLLPLHKSWRKVLLLKPSQKTSANTKPSKPWLKDENRLAGRQTLTRLNPIFSFSFWPLSWSQHSDPVPSLLLSLPSFKLCTTTACPLNANREKEGWGGREQRHSAQKLSRAGRCWQSGKRH